LKEIAPRKGILVFALRGALADVRRKLPDVARWIENFAGTLRDSGMQPTLSTNRPTRGRFTADAWSRVEHGLMAGEIDSVSVSSPLSLDRGVFATVRGVCRGILHPAVVDLKIQANYRSGPPLDESQFIDLCLAAAEASGLAQGLMLERRDPDRFAEQTPFERRFVLQPPDYRRFGPNALSRYVRGVGWGLWLTDGHLHGLGGRAKVEREAPVSRVVARSSGLWLEATPSPWDLTDEALKNLEAFLGPIFPTPEKLREADEPLDRPPSVLEMVQPADHYPDYHGPPVNFEGLTTEGPEAINVHLSAVPTAEAREALERAIAGWYLTGVEGAYAPGGFHSIHGPEWDNLTARWVVDMGPAALQAALQDLTRRLAGWSEAWGCAIKQVYVGVEEP
jgi:hypothetical protein